MMHMLCIESGPDFGIIQLFMSRLRPALLRATGHKGPWEDAWADFRRLDAKAELHGSRRVGIGCSDSDVDVVSSMTLEEIVEITRSRASPRAFEIDEHVRWARVPRLLLRHRPTDIQVDIICQNQLDSQSNKRDEVVLVLLNACPLARDLVMQIGDWAHAYAAAMPPKEGLLSMAIHGYPWLHGY
ncbi:unnamed protein product [Cladocopium goreaui]|uniref:Uncharacterized protein n=1 Tax=Cladocopium goreaui TaxID=2562237 RepID=A0A9P1G019_9DINO|nr:unnamed protein product [Cladocopium goreaui]